MDRKVLLSLLSMDVYNRGVQTTGAPGAAGIRGLNDTGMGNLIDCGDHNDIVAWSGET